MKQSPHLPFYARVNTRGNDYKLINHSFHYDLHKHFFLHTLLISGTLCLIQSSMLARLMHLKHGGISFGRTKQLNFYFAIDLIGTGNKAEEVIK